MTQSMKSKLNYFLLVCAAFCNSFPANAETEIPQVTIKQIMESVITPPTNTLWGADDPKTDEEWKNLEDAAIAVIASGALINLGGSGPNDNNWVKEPAWRAFTKVMTDAGKDALKAIRAKNMDALFEAGDVLYPPCEGCHLKFNPGVINQ